MTARTSTHLNFRLLRRTLPGVLVILLCSACTSVKGPGVETDPLEPFNRSMFSFNETLDENILRPVAEGYQAHVPDPIQTGVSNFFGNLGDVISSVNTLLQFKFEETLSNLGRVLVNSTIGLFGLIDVATPMGLTQHSEDFGQTLGTWGVGDGPYLVLPFYGSSTLRDTTAMSSDWRVDPMLQIQDPVTYWATEGLWAIDTRVGLLKASNIVEEASFDKYAFIRDAYLQLRENRIYDGNPPRKFAPPPPPSAQDRELELELEKELNLGK